MILFAVALSYALGSVPTGLWLGRWLRGVDIRQHGSKNIGATNTLRVLGKSLGALALAGDIGKGAIAVLLFARLADWPYAALACGVAAILGHSASLFLKFQGGKGVATSAGVFLGLAPLPTLIGVAVFALVVAWSRMVSAGSIVAAVAMSVAVFLLPHEWATWPTRLMPEGPVLRIIAASIAAFVVIKHRSNVARIVRGEESRIF